MSPSAFSVAERRNIPKLDLRPSSTLGGRLELGTVSESKCSRKDMTEYPQDYAVTVEKRYLY